MQPQPLKATKWLSQELLLTEEELQALFEELKPFTLYFNGGVVEEGKSEIDPKKFISSYGEYLAELKSGSFSNPLAFRQRLTAVMSRDPGAVHLTPVTGGRAIVRVVKPAIQLFEHVMNYAEKEGRFHSMVHGTDTISWGLIFTYPQLYEDPLSRQPVEVFKDPTFPNTALFRRLQQWARKNSMPTPLKIGGKRLNITARLGKEAFSIAKSHPQLAQKGIVVDAEN